MNIVKQYLPKSLLGRMLIIVIAPLIILQLMLLIIFFERHWKDVEYRLSRINAGHIAIIAYLYHQPLQSFQQLQQTTLSHLHIRVKHYPDKTSLPQLAITGYNDTEEQFITSIRERISQQFILDNTQSSRYRYIYILLENNGLLSIEIPYKRLFSSTTYVFVVVMVCFSFIVLIISGIFLRNQIKPIRFLAEASERFGKGIHINEHQPTQLTIPLKGSKEIRQATDAFNVMIERINRQISQRTHMLSGVSHDLRTPITRMRLQIAMLDQKKPEIIRLKKNLINMEKMIDGYLNFARGNYHEPSTIIIMPDFIKQLCDDWKDNNHDINIDYHCEEYLQMAIKPNALKRALDNIISNAYQHADHIWIRLAKRKNDCHITIDDDGSGIEEKNYENAFKPFNRLDKKQKTDNDSVGLGLSIALDVARTHGGDIKLSQSPQGGLRVNIILPL